MRGGMGAKKKAAKAGAAAVAVRNSPYIQRLADDEDLRQNLWDAYESARDAVGRLQNGKHPTKQIFDDKKLQKDLKAAAESFRDASVALREAPKKVLDALFGAEEEFEYSATTAPSTATPPTDATAASTN